MPKIIYLFRHALSCGNQANIASAGITDPLSEAGIRQVLSTRERIGKNMPEFSRCYVSGYARARETAELLLPGREFIMDERLNEMDLGECSKLGMREIKEKIPDIFNYHRKIPGGESRLDLFNRASKWLEDETAKIRNGESILAVTHAGPIECILQYICNIREDSIPIFFPENASFTKLVWYDADFLFGNRNGWLVNYFSRIFYGHAEI